jgi:hypothetical protein
MAFGAPQAPAVEVEVLAATSSNSELNPRTGLFFLDDTLQYEIIKAIMHYL